MTRVLLTHADHPLGRRIAKRLYHDRRVECIVATGNGRPPRAFDRMLAGAPPRMQWAQADLSRHRSASDLFRSAILREVRPDSVVYVPRHAAADAAPRVHGVPPRTAEARLVLQHALESPVLTSLVALGSAFVYRLAPGNANCLSEDSELDLAPDVDADRRAWIDCDMLFHGEVGNERLRVVLLRLPAVVGHDGAVHLHPALEGRSGPRWRPLGFDPICAVITDHDAARAVQAAIHSPARGVFHVQGMEVLPLSVLARWTGRPTVPLPGALLRALGGGGPELHYGFSLDTSRAERELGFRPAYRVGPSRAGDGRARLETWPA